VNYFAAEIIQFAAPPPDDIVCDWVFARDLYRPRRQCIGQQMEWTEFSPGVITIQIRWDVAASTAKRRMKEIRMRIKRGIRSSSLGPEWQWSSLRVSLEPTRPCLISFSGLHGLQCFATSSSCLLDELTENAPSPSCQAKSFPNSPNHFEEFDLTRATASERGMVGGNRKRRCM
jgi:hypothetical protein